MFVIRISSAFVIVVLVTKVSLFVADDSKFIEVESLAGVEKRVGKLIDEAMRHRGEEEEREDEAESLAFAVRFVAARKAIRLCVDGVCSWVRSGVVAASRKAASIAYSLAGDAAAGYAERLAQTEKWLPLAQPMAHDPRGLLLNP